MDTEFWCRIFIISICIRRSITLVETEPSGYEVVSMNDNTRIILTETTALATTDQPYRICRWQTHDCEGYVAIDARMSHEDDHQVGRADDHSDDSSNTKVMRQANNDYWGGYYDFLVNEGSYKFWAVFQLATAALLIYSGFAALYYAKVNPQITEDYDDFLLKRRRRFVDLGGQPRERPYFGFEPQSFQRILDAVAREIR